MDYPKERSLSQVWKVVTYGGKSTVETFEELRECGCLVTGSAHFAMLVIGQSNPLEPVEVALARATVAELGFEKDGEKDSAPIEKVFRRIREIGGLLCSPHVAPQLRIRCPDQPRDEDMYVAMDVILGEGSAPQVFELCHPVRAKERYGLLLPGWAKTCLDVASGSSRARLPLDRIVVYALRK